MFNRSQGTFDKTHTSHTNKVILIKGNTNAKYSHDKAYPQKQYRQIPVSAKLVDSS